MEANRQAALANGDKTFIGALCTKDEGHGDERYASSGRCVVCAAETSKAQRDAKPKPKRPKPTMTEWEITNLLLAGGPNSRAQAEAAGLEWYNKQIGCPNIHEIVTLDGQGCGQPGCGWRKPVDGVVLSKQALDLLG